MVLPYYLIRLSVNYIFEKKVLDQTIKSYEQQEKTYDQKQKNKAFQEAKEYNEDLTKSAVQLTDPFKAKKAMAKR